MASGDQWLDFLPEGRVVVRLDTFGKFYGWNFPIFVVLLHNLILLILSKICRHLAEKFNGCT
jgi:hypothetical protein